VNPKYQVVYADPPWRFKNYSDKWHEGREESRWVGNQYGLMNTDDVGRLDIPSIVADDAALFLWATYPSLPAALHVIEAWGFTYKTCAFTWAKMTKTGSGWFTGMGFWTRSNAELCLLATRGHPKRVSKSVRQLVVAPVRRHSEKPDAVRDRIVDLMGDVPRIELFARQRTEGWSTWGDEIECDVEIPLR
jgi:N6-adenosine-specific RNA methylase IME4